MATTATNAQQPAKPGPEHQRLEVLVGTWHTEGQTFPSGDAPAVKIRSLDTYEWLPGGFFVLHRWDARIGDAEGKGVEIIGYDPSSRTYRTHFFDNQGGSGTEQLDVRGKTWTWRGRGVMGAAEHRCTSVESDDGNTMSAHHERSEDGTTWEPWMDVTLRRADS